MFDRKRIVFALCASLMAGCELAQVPQATPTLNATESATLQPSAEPTATPSATRSPIPQLESPVPTFTLGTPTETPTETPTPNPYATYVIQPGDTLLYIIQQPPFFYRTDSVVNDILRLNPNMPDINHLPAPGSSIIIPLPSATPTPEDFELTASAQPNLPQVQLPGNAQIIQVEVKEGETILGIAGQNATTLVILATLNPQLPFYNCDFTNPSGGPDCNVPLRIGDPVNVPALTPTPTLSPTFSGSETATPIPTYAAPILIFPPQEGSAPPRSFQLQWISAGELKDNESYIVQIEDETAGTEQIDVTRTTSYELPEALIPSDGQTHTIHWRVWVGVPNEQGVYLAAGAQGDYRTFYWQSR